MLRELLNRRTKMGLDSVRSACPDIESLEIRRLFSGLTFKEFPQIGMGTNFLQNLTAGPDGNVYFSSGLANNVDSISPAGVVTVHDTTPVGANGPGGIVKGADGNVYFDASNNLGKITLPAGTVSNVPLSSALDTAGLLTLGPDGNFWATCFFSVIERITPTGQVTNFNFSGSGSGQIRSFNGGLYFASGAFIRDISTNGTFGTPYATPSGGNVEGIAVGPDGNLWFTEQLTSGSNTSNFYGYLTPAGVIKEFPSTIGPVSGIAAGSDGNMYFRAADYVVGVNLAGTVFATQDLGGGNNTDGKELITGPDGNLWYNESFGDDIGTIYVTGSGATPTPTPTGTTPTPTPTTTPTDTIPPQAALASAPDFTAGTAATYDFNVNYTDNVAVSRPTINNSNVTVTGPNGPIPVTLGSITVIDDADITATYQITAPVYTGSYAIDMAGDSVTDTSGNPVAPGLLGLFNVTGQAYTPTPTPVPTPTPTGPQPALVSSLPGTLPNSVVEGNRGEISLQLTNSGAAAQNGPVSVTLFVSPIPVIDSDSYQITPLVEHRVKLAIGATKVLPLRFKYPVSVPQGDYYILAEVGSGIATSTVYTGKSILLANPFIDLAAGFAIHPSVTFAANGTGTAYVDVTNGGNVTAHGRFKIALSAIPTDGSAAVHLPTYSRITRLYPGQEKLFTIHFRFPPELTDGTYNFSATVDPNDLFADTNQANNTAIDPITFIYG